MSIANLRLTLWPYNSRQKHGKLKFDCEGFSYKFTSFRMKSDTILLNASFYCTSSSNSGSDSSTTNTDTRKSRKRNRKCRQSRRKSRQRRRVVNPGKANEIPHFCALPSGSRTNKGLRAQDSSTANPATTTTIST